MSILHDSSVELSCDVFLTFSWISQLKHLLLRAFLAGDLPKKLSKVGVLDERSMNKSRKYHAGASPESPSTVKNNKFVRFGTHPRIHRIHQIHRKRCQQLRRSPTRPGPVRGHKIEFGVPGWLGWTRLGSARPGPARLGSGSARLGSARLGSARPGPARPGPARLGPARPGPHSGATPTFFPSPHGERRFIRTLPNKFSLCF